MKLRTVITCGIDSIQFQTLKCHFPIGFSFEQMGEDDLDLPDRAEHVLRHAWCLFVNPQVLTAEQLERLLAAHGQAAAENRAAMLLFTDPFTEAQQNRCGRALAGTHSVDLRAGLDRELRIVLKLTDRIMQPCWNRMDAMYANMFNDGWYLLDLDMTGRNPLSDDITAAELGYMADYRLRSVETFEITNAGTVSREEAQPITGRQLVERLQHLPQPAPLLLWSSLQENFLTALFHSCGEVFDLPCLRLEGLAPMTYRKYLYRNAVELLECLGVLADRERTSVDWIYQLAVRIFHALRDGYDLHGPGQLEELLDCTIE